MAPFCMQIACQSLTLHEHFPWQRRLQICEAARDRLAYGWLCSHQYGHRCFKSSLLMPLQKADRGIPSPCEQRSDRALPAVAAQQPP